MQETLDFDKFRCLRVLKAAEKEPQRTGAFRRDAHSFHRIFFGMESKTSTEVPAWIETIRPIPLSLYGDEPTVSE